MNSKSRSCPPRIQRLAGVRSTRRRRARNAEVAGYTIVEVMMALSVLAVGGMGVVGLQKFAVVGSLDARGITGASTVATGWVDFCQNEAAAWNKSDNSDTGDMQLVSAALACHRFRNRASRSAHPQTIRLCVG